MKFEFKAVRKKIDLGEYAEEMSGAVIRVQVNVDRATFLRILEVSKETPAETVFELLHDLWHEGTPEDSPGYWPVEHIRALYEHCWEKDPQLGLWLSGKSFNLVYEYQAGQKKG